MLLSLAPRCFSHGGVIPALGGRGGGRDGGLSPLLDGVCERFSGLGASVTSASPRETGIIAFFSPRERGLVSCPSIEGLGFYLFRGGLGATPRLEGICGGFGRGGCNFPTLGFFPCSGPPGEGVFRP